VNYQIAVLLQESSQTGEARRVAVNSAAQWGLQAQEAGRLAIIVTELARNVVQHGGGGEVLIGRCAQGGVELLALDRGPGMKNVAECLRDGYSTAGTPGTGLGAIRRLSDFFDIYSVPGQGTAVLVRVCTPRTGRAHEWDLGAVCLAARGEKLPGDCWSVLAENSELMLMIADGIGHGPAAAEAATAAVEVFSGCNGWELHDCMESIHLALRKTRGAAVALASVDSSRAEVRFVGVGNISGLIITGTDTVRTMVSHNGLVGHVLTRIHEFVYPWPSEGLLIMHSDGLATLHLENYADLLRKHPSLIAGVLYRDFTRGRDDVTVLVARRGRSE
jgi:anti-sigma regulatory factor (Ser/Thr protein kinase)